MCIRKLVRVEGFVYRMDEFKGCDLDYFPENILIDVLSFLSVRELVRAGRYENVALMNVLDFWFPVLSIQCSSMHRQSQLDDLPLLLLLRLLSGEFLMVSTFSPGFVRDGNGWLKTKDCGEQ